ncbi:MAG: AI-2E family transporter [Gammaproteobacteria bacterium]
MWQTITQCFKRYFSDPEAIALLFTLLGIIVFLLLFGRMLAPVIISLVIAYLLDGIVKRLERWKCPHLLAVSIVCLLFIGAVLIAFIWLLPLLWQQLSNFFNELPNILGRSQLLLTTLPQRYPEFISQNQITHVITLLKSESGSIGKVVLSYSLASIPSLIEFFIYFVLVPLLVFFFLKDKDTILHWFMGFLPKRRRAITQIWHDVNAQTGNYIRGRLIEMVLVGIVFVITFEVFGLNYAVLLSVIAAVSVIIPYVGAIVATIPIVVVAFTQWGWSAQFAYLLIAYTVISIVDSNILVPLLFSETMSLHPVAIIVAVIVFGKIWGFWGIFFAIPLATVVKAIMEAWPQYRVEYPETKVV